MRRTWELPRVRCFAAHPSAAAEAREFVREQSREINLEPGIAEELTLAVSEACMNAIRHSDSLIVLVSWKWEDREVEVQVKDDGIFRQELPITGDPDREGGLGIALMMAMVDEFAIRQGTFESPGTLVKLRKSATPQVARPNLVMLPPSDARARRPA